MNKVYLYKITVDHSSFNYPKIADIIAKDKRDLTTKVKKYFLSVYGLVAIDIKITEVIECYI